MKKVKFEDQYHEKVHFIYDERLVNPVGYFCQVYNNRGFYLEVKRY